MVGGAGEARADRRVLTRAGVMTTIEPVTQRHAASFRACLVVVARELHYLPVAEIGRAVHDEPTVPNRYDPWQTDVLSDGFDLTIEPMVSARSKRAIQDADGWTLRSSDGSLAAHHEHTLVITRGAPLVLTGAAA